MVLTGFDAIIGQQLPIRILKRFVHKAEVPHALMFAGIEGIGKCTTARIFAMALNCAEGTTAGENAKAPGVRPCGQCRSCRQIAEGSHPDVIEVSPRKKILRIDQVRHLLSVLAMKPFSAGHRVVIVKNAHSMNREAGNALLKALEEPPADTTLILTALQRNDVLPTIASRCRHIRFNPLSPEDLTSLLVEKLKMDDQQAEVVAEAAGGSYTKALSLAEERWSEQRDWLIRAAGLDRPEELRQRSPALALAFSSLLMSRKERIESDLETLKTWIRDLSVVPYQPKRVIHRDRRELLQNARADASVQQLIALWEGVETAQKAIAANGNLRLTLDVMALNLTNALRA